MLSGQASAVVSSKQLVGEIMEFKASLWQLCAKNVFSQKAKWCAITCFKYHSHSKTKSQKKRTREPICFSNYTRSWYEQKLYFMLMSSNLNNSNPLQISKLFLFCLWAIVSAPNTTDCYTITSFETDLFACSSSHSQKYICLLTIYGFWIPKKGKK